MCITAYSEKYEMAWTRTNACRVLRSCGGCRTRSRSWNEDVGASRFGVIHVQAGSGSGQRAPLYERVVDRAKRRVVELDARRPGVVAQLLGPRRADDRARDVRLAEDPRERELRHREAEAVRDRPQALHALEARRRR